MKKLLSILFFAIVPLLCFSQGMKIKWEDSSGREFSINTHTRNFEYSMVAGDKIYYNSTYSGGPEGSVKSVGNVKIYYNGAYSGGPEGTVKSVGGLKVYYNSAYSGGPEGSIKSTSGSVN